MHFTTDQTGQRTLGVADGFDAFTGGIGFVVATPRVWGYALVPCAMMFILSIGLTVAGFWGAGRVSDAIFGTETEWLGQVGGWAVTAVLAVAGFFLALFLALALAQPLSGFALDAISRTQTLMLAGQAPPPVGFAFAFLQSLQVALVTLVVGGLLLGALFVVSVLFPPALLVTVPLKVLVSGWMLAWNFLDYPLTLHGFTAARRLAWVGRHFAAFTAFGIAWALIVFIPGVLLLVLPMGVAGAARLVVDAEYA